VVGPFSFGLRLRKQRGRWALGAWGRFGYSGLGRDGRSFVVGFCEKEGVEDTGRILSEHSHTGLIRVLEWLRGGAERWIYGNAPLLK